MQTLTSKLEAKRNLAAHPRAEACEEKTSQPSVSIEYCVPGNYERMALALAEAVQGEVGETAFLVPSRDGVFEVSIHGRLVFSKRACSRFPDREEIFYHLKNS